jgi:hypothetical protein
MSTSTHVTKRTVALFLNRKSIPQLIADAKFYVEQMTGNTNFPAPNPTLAGITNEISILETAYTLSQTRVQGAVAQMHSEAKALRISLKALGAYVELQANQDIEHAGSIIESAGMTVKNLPQRAPRIFSAKAGIAPGTVKLDTKAVKRGTYIYQMSLTSNNPNSWTEIYQGTRVKFTATDLKTGTLYYFRTCTVDKNGKSAWSYEVSCMVP